MRALIITLLLTINFFVGLGQKLDSANQKVVSNFIDCFKSQNKEKLIDKISFPLSREYPLPEIKNKQEFLERYSEVFDDSLTKMIINSKLSTDWKAVGWRGIMLFYGSLWLDYDGTLVAVNYQSEVERKKKEELIRTEKSSLYESIRELKWPVCILETKQYRIRIDDLGDGNYRYASWPLKSKMSSKPDLIIEKGEYVPEGSGGNHKYEFKSGDYIYDCEIIVMGEDDSPPASLVIYKNSKEILSQDAKIVVK